MYTSKERATRFQDAREVYNRHGKQSMREVAAMCGVQFSMISELENYDSSRSVGYEKVITLAEHYGVSADYLLGLSDTPSLALDRKNASSFTGLSEKGMTIVVSLTKSRDEKRRKAFSDIIERGMFNNLIDEILYTQKEARNISVELLSLARTIDQLPQWFALQRKLRHIQRDFAESIERHFRVITDCSTPEITINKVIEELRNKQREQEATDAEEE